MDLRLFRCCSQFLLWNGYSEKELQKNSYESICDRVLLTTTSIYSRQFGWQFKVAFLNDIYDLYVFIDNVK